MDDVIMLINFYLDYGERKSIANSARTDSNQIRIRVNDKTATGGWF